MPDITIGRLRGGFCVSWYEHGKRRRYQLAARSRKDAEAEALDVYRAQTLPKGGPLVADIWAAYRLESEGKTIAANMEWSGRAILPFFGALRPDQIHVETCALYIKEREKMGRKSGTIRTELGHLRIALVWAEKRKVIDRAPYIKKPVKPMSRERWLTRDEMTRLVDATVEPHIRLAILLMISTAGRIGAILDLQWNRVDLDRNQINLRLPDDFRRKGRAIVPINATLREELLFAREAALTDYVVEWGGRPVKSIRKGFSAAVERAGIDHATPHDLRRSAARLMAEAGISMSEIAQFLGHSNTATTFEVYARFSPEHLRGAAEVLDFTSEKVHRSKRNSA